MPLESRELAKFVKGLRSEGRVEVKLLLRRGNVEVVKVVEVLAIKASKNKHASAQKAG